MNDTFRSQSSVRKKKKASHDWLDRAGSQTVQGGVTKTNKRQESLPGKQNDIFFYCVDNHSTPTG